MVNVPAAVSTPALKRTAWVNCVAVSAYALAAKATPNVALAALSSQAMALFWVTSF